MKKARLVSIVVPVFNEEEAIAPFLEAVDNVIAEAAGRFAQPVGFEIVFVNDGSRDGTLARILEAQRRNRRIRAVDLSRNFGKEAALTAGLVEARGDAVVLIDVDMQDPPGLIPQMIDKWLEGAKVVLARRSDRSEDSLMKRRTAGWFYVVHNLISNIAIPRDVGDFRLMDRAVVDETNRLPENRRFMKGIFAWVGFEPVVIEYRRNARGSGKTKFSGWKLWRFAVEGITSFSDAPLVIWTYLGITIAALSLAYASFIVIDTLAYGRDVPGYASLIVGILFLGGIQLLGIGVLGEYIGRIYSEVKRRPPYIVGARYEAKTAQETENPAAGTGR